jgi:hypothetical protein
MLGKKGQTERSSPLFSHFLTLKAFFLLYVAGLLAIIGWLHMNWTIGDMANLTTSGVSLFIFVFLAPCVYFLAKKISNEFETFFEKDLPEGIGWYKRAGFPQINEMRYLFSKDRDFKHYRKEARKMLNDRKERYFSIGLAFCFILPLLLLEDLYRGLPQSVFLGSLFSWSAFEYSYWMIYWSIIYSLLLSGVWMVITFVRALLRLEKEKPHLHITQTIAKLRESFQLLDQTDLSRAKIGLLDLSFRRFKAGLSPIVNSVLSLSLKIAFIGMFCSIPALVYFLIARKVMIIWYGLCLFSCLLSVAVFVTSQYGISRLWSNSKKDAIKLLDHICAIKTQQCSSLYSIQSSSNSKQMKEVEKDVSFLHRLNADINQLTTVTYTSSSIFKLVSVNFLSFGPTILAQVLIQLILK